MKLKFATDQWIYYLFCGAFFVIPMGTSPFTILGGCALLIWLFTGEFLRSRDGYLKEEWLLPVVAILILTWLGLIWSLDPSVLGLKYAKKSHYWLYALAVASISFSGNRAENLIKAFLGGLLLNSLVGFLQLIDIVPEFSEWGKHTGFSGGYNTLSILLILGMMTSSFRIRASVNNKGRLIYSSYLLIYFMHLMILPGRGGYLTFVLLSPIIVYNILHGKKWYFMLLTYLLVIGIMISSPIVRHRAAQVGMDLQLHLKEGGDVASGKIYSKHVDRIYMWRWAIDLFMEHPLIGVGTGGYSKAILESGGDMGIAHPHNNVLHVAVSYGIVGLSVFGWFFWILLKMGWQNRARPVGFFVLASSLVILVGGLTDTHILDAGGASLLAVTTGILSSLPKEDKENKYRGKLHDGK